MGSSNSNLRQATRIIAQMFPAKPTFSVDQVPDLTGRVALVTGGNAGIGKETMKVLLQHNAKVYMAGRGKAKADAAIAELKALTGKEAIFLELDLSNLASVRKAAEEFLSKESALHILFNNAGVMWPPIDQLTADGYDMQFGTNVLGHFLLTELLLPALEAGATSSPDHHSRVVTIASNGGYLGKLRYETFRDHTSRAKLGTKEMYFQSKLANAVVAREAARRYADKGILSFSVHPGTIHTELQRYSSGGEKWFMKMTGYSVEYGVLSQIWAGTMPDAIQANGEFIIPWARVGRMREEVYDPRVGEELWAYLEGQVKTR